MVHTDLYSFWIEAQKPLQSVLRVDDGCARIQDTIEIRAGEVRLKGKNSLETLTKFVRVLEQSAYWIGKGLPELKDLVKRVEEGKARTPSMADLKHRLEHMERMLSCCKSLLELLEPITSNNFSPLLEPQLLDLLCELCSCFGGYKSPPISVIATFTYDI